MVGRVHRVLALASKIGVVSSSVRSGGSSRTSHWHLSMNTFCSGVWGTAHVSHVSPYSCEAFDKKGRGSGKGQNNKLTFIFTISF